MPILELTDVRKSYRTPDGRVACVLDVPALSLDAGQQVAMRGESGSGKTTLLHVIAGILRPDSGTVRVADEDVAAMSEAARDHHRARHLGYIFQTFNLLQGHTALENVRLAMAFGAGVDQPRAIELLKRVGLADRLHYSPSQLSVGQQQRVAIARALANKPALVLADEPTGNLDRANADAAIDLIRAMCSEANSALLLVSHDDRVLQRFDGVLDLASLNRAAATGSPV